jgi:hypothetical protein
MAPINNENNKLVVAVTATTLAEPLLVGFMHAGGVGAIAGLIIGGAAYALTDDVAGLLGKHGDGGVENSDEGKQGTSSLPSLPADTSKKLTNIGFRLLNGKRFRDDQLDTSLDKSQTDSAEESSDDEYYIRLGDNLEIYIDDVLSNRFVILGMPGQGKGNAVALLCEEVAQFDVPLIIFDSKPEYGPLCQKPYFLNPYRASAQNVMPENAEAFGFALMKERLQVVLDLPSYGDDDVAAQVMINIIVGIKRFEDSLPKLPDESKKYHPVMIVLEEAAYWLPQDQQSTVSKKQVKQSNDKRREGEKDGLGGMSLFGRFQKLLFWTINQGRSFGMGTVISTQRPADVDNRAIAVAEWKVLFKANQPQDQAIYRGYGAKCDASKLKQGQACIIGPGDFDEGGVYQFDRRKSPDAAKTPGIANLRGNSELLVDPETVERTIGSMPVVDRKDRKYAKDYTPFDFHNGPIASPYYPSSVYNGQGRQENVNGPQNGPVNGSASVSNALQDRLVNGGENSAVNAVNGPMAPVDASVNAVNVNGGQVVDTSGVSADKRETIRRLVELSTMGHRDIAKVVKLDGRNYPIYQQVCAEEGIDTTAKRG